MLSAKKSSTFLGVLTHLDSRYSLSHIEMFSANLAKAGALAQVRICRENLSLPEEKRVTRLSAAKTAFFDAALRMRWYFSLPNRTARNQGIYFIFVDLSRRILDLMSRGGLDRAQKSMTRQRNISLGHAQLWTQALESMSDWTLFLEDDASPIDISTTHIQLQKVVEYLASATETTPNSYCDLSLSYSSAQLGVEIAGHPALRIGDQVLHKVSMPFSNTLCAVLMSRPMLQSLSDAVKGYLQSSTARYIPIDWLVNKFFLESPGKLESTSFFNLEPGLFIQESFRPPNR